MAKKTASKKNDYRVTSFQEKRDNKIKALINAALEHGYSNKELLTVFIGMLEKEHYSEKVDVQNVLCDFCEYEYDMIKPNSGKYIMVSTDTLNMNQYDKIKGFFESEIFTCYNEQQTAMQF